MALSIFLLTVICSSELKIQSLMVFIDEKLNWKRHFDPIAQKVSKGREAMGRVSNIVLKIKSRYVLKKMWFPLQRVVYS